MAAADKRPPPEEFGLPKGMQAYSPAPYAGMNLSASRMMIDDRQATWIENFVKIGDGNLRTLWDAGPTIYTATGAQYIIYFFFYNISVTQFCAVFFNDGTALQVNVVTKATTWISSTAAMFCPTGMTIPGPIPCCCQYGSSYLLISNNHVENAYWIWDGVNLYGAGSLSPVVELDYIGMNYTSAPTVTAVGGSGTGATFTAEVLNGTVVNVTCTNPGSGYLDTDSPQLLFSGGGSDSTAYLTATISLSAVAQIAITNPGYGYTALPNIIISAPPAGGTQATAICTGIDGGGVSIIQITNPGAGYTAPPTISTTGGGGGGNNFAAYAIISGAIGAVTVVNGGSGYTGTPQIEVLGGGGSGATIVAQVTSGAITGVQVTNFGYNFTTAPTLVVGTTFNHAAAASISLMPFGVSGNTIETYLSRVWLGNVWTNSALPTAHNNSGAMLLSAPGSLSDFATSDGGLVFPSTDRFLRQQFTALRQSNGYLYTMGDSSVGVISNVQTQGSPPTTTFSNQNTDPQIGTIWRDSCQDFSRTILFGNAMGIFGVYGGAVTKVSSELDPLFETAVYGTSAGEVPIPSSAVANIYGKKYFLYLLTITDPFTLTPRTVMLAWDEKQWTIASQLIAITRIGTQEVASDMTAWCTDGFTVRPMFQTPSGSLLKIYQSKLIGGSFGAFALKRSVQMLFQAQDMSSPQVSPTITYSIDTEVGAVTHAPVTWSVSSGYSPAMPVILTPTEDVAGLYLGFTLTTTTNDFVLDNVALVYTPTSGQYGSLGLQLS